MLYWTETSNEVMPKLNYTKVGQLEDIQQH